ncbi:MAG: CinA family protein [Nocardioidaceae bacterium]
MSEQQDLASEIATAATEQRVTVAVAESLTGGLVASSLAAAPGASRWFRGAVVAYASEVKHELLAVPAGPVASEQAARAMAAAVADLLGADLTLAITGVGGPGLPPSLHPEPAHAGPPPDRRKALPRGAGTLRMRE